MEWLANISVTYVLIISAVLFIVRMILKSYNTPSAKSAKETVESVLVAVVLVFMVIRPFIVQAFFIPSQSMEPTLLGHDSPSPVHDRILVNKFIYRFHEPRRGDVIVFKAPPVATTDLKILLDKQQYPVEISEGEYKQTCNLVIGKVTSAKVDNGEVEVTIDKYPAREFQPVDIVCLLKPGSGGKVYQIEKKTGNGTLYTLKLTGLGNATSADDLVGSEVRVAERDYIKRLIGVPGDTLQVKNGKLYRNGKMQNETYLNEPFADYDMKPVTIPKGKVFAMGDNRNNSNDGHVWGPLDRDRILGKAMVKFFPITRIGLVH